MAGFPWACPWEYVKMLDFPPENLTFSLRMRPSYDVQTYIGFAFFLEKGKCIKVKDMAAFITEPPE